MANSWLVCRLRSTFGHMLLRLLLLLCWLCPLTAVVGQSTTQLIAEYKQVVRKNPTKAAQLARKVADEYLKKGPNFNARQGLRYAELSLEAAKRANSQTEQAETYFFIGSYKQQFDETRVEALRYLNAAYSLYSKLPKHDQTANVLYLLGITYDKEHEYYKAARVLETLIGFISEKNLKFPYENYARFKLQQTRQKAGIAAPAEQVIAAGGNDTLISTPGSAELVKLELEDEFKQRIEEMDFVNRLERTQQIGVYIPTTISVDTPIDASIYVERSLDFMAKLFGGATSKTLNGTWNSNEAGVVKEEVYLIYSYVTAQDVKTSLSKVVQYVKDLKAELQQEAMALEVNKKLTFI